MSIFLPQVRRKPKPGESVPVPISIPFFPQRKSQSPKPKLKSKSPSPKSKSKPKKFKKLFLKHAGKNTNFQVLIHDLANFSFNNKNFAIIKPILKYSRMLKEIEEMKRESEKTHFIETKIIGPVKSVKHNLLLDLLHERYEDYGDDEKTEVEEDDEKTEVDEEEEEKKEKIKHKKPELKSHTCSKEKQEIKNLKATIQYLETQLREAKRNSAIIPYRAQVINDAMKQNFKRPIMAVVSSVPRRSPKKPKPQRRRCKNGLKYNVVTKRCELKINSLPGSKRKRCTNGTRYDPITKNCKPRQ